MTDVIDRRHRKAVVALRRSIIGCRMGKLRLLADKWKQRPTQATDPDIVRKQKGRDAQLPGAAYRRAEEAAAEAVLPPRN